VRHIDIAAATQDANRRVRVRMDYGRSYLMAITDERNVVAQCIADEALRGQAHYHPWLAEYVVLCQMRDRQMARFAQDEAERRQRAELRKAPQA
jgi:myo-inositol-hexaphosphate 3-phosphohydrolase